MYSGVHMKLLVVPNNLEFNRFRDLGVHSFLVGIQDFSTNFKTSLSVDEIRDLCEKYPEEEIFLSFNKNLFNHELPVVESILKELDSLPIAGIFFLRFGNFKIGSRTSFEDTNRLESNSPCHKLSNM